MVRRIVLLFLSLNILLIFGCGPQATPVPTDTPELARELILYNWGDYMPQSVLDDFTEEYGVKVDYQTYESEEEAAENIRAGKVYDLVVLPPELIPALIKGNHLAKINYKNIPNFKNVSVNFRDLSFDPRNEHSVPFHWGTTGILVRRDLVEKPVTRWADLWNKDYAGKVALWPIPRSLIAIALKSLGYKANSENPLELDAALQYLLVLKKLSFFVSNETPSIVPTLQSGEAVIAYGWAYDAAMAQQENLPIDYILPADGTLLWGDNFVIPANSSRQYTAELFLNFILRPEISGRIVNESYYAMANDAATPFIKPEILKNQLIYPSNEALRKAEIILPLTEQGDKLYNQIWQSFMEGKED